MNGRFLDLHLHHRTFVNASFGKRDLDYLSYLDQFARFDGVPRGKKFHDKYSQYLEELFEYLRGFHERTRPLTFLTPVLRQLEERFEPAWEAGTVPGWADKGVSGAEQPEGCLDLDVFESPAVRAPSSSAAASCCPMLPPPGRANARPADTPPPALPASGRSSSRSAARR